jgi:hypothetical protein
VSKVRFAQLLSPAVKLVRQALDEEHPKDELLKFRGVHLAAQNIGSFEQETFKLGESYFFFLQCLARSLAGSVDFKFKEIRLTLPAPNPKEDKERWR